MLTDNACCVTKEAKQQQKANTGKSIIKTIKSKCKTKEL